MYLVFNLNEWRLYRKAPELGFAFTDDELYKALASDDGLIGTRKGVDCYISFLICPITISS